MRQFDIVRIGKRSNQLGLVLQSDIITAGVNTVMVAPVESIADTPGISSGMAVIIGGDRAASIVSMAAIPAKACGESIENVEHLREPIIAAIDLIFTGF